MYNKFHVHALKSSAYIDETSSPYRLGLTEEVTDLTERPKKRNYFKSGKSKIYSFRLDGYPQVDWIIKDQTRYQGLGHCADLPYTFGVPYFWKYSWIFEGFDPEPWEYELNEAIKKEWTSLFKVWIHEPMSFSEPVRKVCGSFLRPVNRVQKVDGSNIHLITMRIHFSFHKMAIPM